MQWARDLEAVERGKTIFLALAIHDEPVYLPAAEPFASPRLRIA